MFKVETFLAFAAIMLANYAGGLLAQDSGWGVVWLGVAVVLLAISTGRSHRAALDVQDAVAVSQPASWGVVQSLLANQPASVGVMTAGPQGLRPVTGVFVAWVGGRQVVVIEEGEAIDV